MINETSVPLEKFVIISATLISVWASDTLQTKTPAPLARVIVSLNIFGNQLLKSKRHLSKSEMKIIKSTIV